MAALSPEEELYSLLERLTPVCGPSGSEEEIRKTLAEIVRPWADHLEVDALGNLIAIRKAAGPGGRRVAVSAHMDEIGIVVTHVADDGFLRFQPVGGLGPHGLPGRRVVFPGGVVGAVGSEKVERIQDLTFDRLFVDIGAAHGEEARAQVPVGTAGCFLGELRRAGRHRVSGKALDDRAGCAVAAALLERLARQDARRHEVCVIFSVQEEVGARGARTAAYALAPDVVLAVDVTATGDTPKSDKLEPALGKGAAIKVQDRSLLVHPQLRALLARTAQEEEIPHQYEVLPFGGTDAGSMHLVREGIPAGVVSIPARYLHTPGEMVDLRDMAAALRLLVAVLQRELDLRRHV